MALMFGIITVSDRSARGEREDASGPLIEKRIIEQGWQVVRREIVPDDKRKLHKLLIDWVRTRRMHVILTTGGTGFSPRDITPEVTRQVVDRFAPGIVEAMRSASLEITPHAMLSRAVAGIRDDVLIVNLPGSPKAALENLEVILPVLPHAVELLQENNQAEMHHSLKK